MERRHKNTGYRLLIKVIVIGYGKRCLKRKSDFSSIPDWDMYNSISSPRVEQWCVYNDKQATIPHFLFLYYEKYKVKYKVKVYDCNTLVPSVHYIIKELITPCDNDEMEIESLITKEINQEQKVTILK